MSKNIAPPEYLDGARVFCWAWSGINPFGVLPFTDLTMAPIAIFGIAVCGYEDSSVFYLFICNKDWEVEQDSGGYGSIDEAINHLPLQYQKVKASWKIR
jgi:hypothetical protein